MADICREYGWTFDEYQEQPLWFLQVITIKMKQEARVRREAEAKLESRLNRKQ